ncbi:MAG: hypothetical protein GF317_06295 [Candidatus Lokiarchaeota archaeon]|nr:hypothetical protein [Candidatus Lokiarchaeota archaeon]MBD3199332.1 hypothetical protein [Candidatus Lokiarchaeota archaeon]
MVVAPIVALKLNEISPIHFEKIGGKATNLYKLIKSNFNVPDGYVLTTDLYNQFLEYNNLKDFIIESMNQFNLSELNNIGILSTQIRKKIENGKFPEKELDIIKSLHKQMGYKTFAVRSSATAEDLENASFAGQYESFLNLHNFEDLISHIKKCYASLWSERVIAYRLKHNIAQEGIKIAIIVQRMVSARSAGVLFTINPITSERSEILIESNYGLGESVMSGACTPDQFILERCGKKTEKSVKITNIRIGKKKFAIQPKKIGHESGIEHVMLSDNENLSSSLRDDELMNLARIGIQIEKLYNQPQDIEWAIDKNKEISILQSRPITSFREKGAVEDIVYSRGYSDDYWNDSSTPLFFDLLGDQLTDIVNVELNSIMGYKKMETKLLKLYNGHVYFNLDVLKRKVENEIPSFMRNEDLLNYFPNGKGKYGKKTIKNLPFHTINRIIGELRIMFFDPNGSISKTDKAYYEWTRKKFNPYYEEFNKKLEKLKIKEDPYELFTLAEDLDILMRDHFRLVRYGIPVHNIGMNLLVQYLLTRFLGKQDCYKYYPILISGLDHKLKETNHKIHELAWYINRNSQLKEIITQTNPKKIYNELKSHQGPSINLLLEKFDKFLEEHGDRGYTREPYYPRWREAPDYVFEILKSLIIEHEQNIENIQTKNEKYRLLVERYIYSRFRGQFLGILKWKIFSNILNLSKRYIKFREAQRFNLDKWITLNRQVFLEIGKIFKKKAIIENIDDIFFLRKKEVDQLIIGDTKGINIEDIKAKIYERKKKFKEYEDKVPPKFIIGDREFNDNLEFDSESISFTGIPASQGIVKGSVRVITRIEDIPKVKAGEILVVPKTDPGWTPIFSKIGGLITETGGVLSHGAVVSREYGIPAVTNISNACKFLKTGQNVTLNGFNGKVMIKD